MFSCEFCQISKKTVLHRIWLFYEPTYGYSIKNIYNSLKSYIIHCQILENINQWIPVSCSSWKSYKRLQHLEAATGRVLQKKLFLTFSSNFIKKETLVQVFSCNFCKISKNTFTYRTPLVAASSCWTLYY